MYTLRGCVRLTSLSDRGVLSPSGRCCSRARTMQLAIMVVRIIHSKGVKLQLRLTATNRLHMFPSTHTNTNFRVFRWDFTDHVNVWVAAFCCFTVSRMFRFSWRWSQHEVCPCTMTGSRFPKLSLFGPDTQKHKLTNPGGLLKQPALHWAPSSQVQHLYMCVCPCLCNGC